MSSFQWMSMKSKSYSPEKFMISSPKKQNRRMSSHHGSPYSSGYVQDEYDFDDDNNDEDYEDDREHEERDESDEDTEEASETDMGKSEEYTEIKEQMYQDKLATLKKQLQQLKDGTHTEYNRKLKKLDLARKERLRLNVIWKEYEIDCVERDYVNEKKAAAKEFEEKKIELRENLISDLEEKRKIIESERHTMELTGDSMEVKPVMTRKLRRRPNDPIPVPEKRRKAPPAQLNYLLDEKDIEGDLKIISRGKLPSFGGVGQGGGNTGSLGSGGIGSVGSLRRPGGLNSCDNSFADTRIEDGKLLYERRWFHRGQPVYVEAKDVSRFAAIISAIGTEAIWVKKTSDGSKVRIYVSQLSRGKFSIKRRAS
ncbi:sin3 histone deacetylase corepressor complex component SDS3 isoform X2 [Ischnura elegans]|uniref:sin3 histone deacetylase corepressor complex component SDS3 isoform X2 n=1 Tax=Ischnura elegans TaxID=197161 RepID=UPI001ED884CA|nr:sin3 histone deacetylase corepressor complex component SDS3 isoform X2 [Ischnura elegans]